MCCWNIWKMNFSVLYRIFNTTKFISFRNIYIICKNSRLSEKSKKKDSINTLNRINEWSFLKFLKYTYLFDYSEFQNISDERVDFFTELLFEINRYNTVISLCFTLYPEEKWYKFYLVFVRSTLICLQIFFIILYDRSCDIVNAQIRVREYLRIQTVAR